MTDDDPREITPVEPGQVGSVAVLEPPVEPVSFEPPRRRPRLKKLRLLVVLVPLSLLALVSAVDPHGTVACALLRLAG